MDCHGYHKNYTGKTIKGFYIEKTTKKNSSKLSKYVDICLTETKETEVFGIRAIPMDTGIDVNKYKPHIYKGNPGELHMISVASERLYHGYDRLIHGMKNYKNQNIYLHLVGEISNKTKRISHNIELNNRVFIYGYKVGEQLEEIYEHCNIGVGPLAPHRVGGKEGTGIKTKEYFAIGLPYFYAGQELLVPDDYPYVLKLDADDTPIDISKVIKFYETIKDDKMMQKNMREFAIENYSWEKILKNAIESIE